MKINQVSVTYGVTVSYKKYRFVRLEYALGAEIAEDENPNDMFNMLRDGLRKKVAKDARAEVEAWRKLGVMVEADSSTPDDLDYDLNFDFD